MSIETLYSSKVEEGIKRWTDNPGPAPATASFGAWSFLSAGAKGVPAGGLESFASGADALSLFAAPGAATFGAMDGADPAGVESARQKMLAGNSFDATAGDALRRKADTFLPDPQTASHADLVIAGLTRGVTKAVTSIATLGPVPGAIAFGVDEGNNAGQRLRMEGVDTGTALKVGAVTGVANAAGALIPMGGSTIAKTVGLAAVGGPGTFMAQEALSRKILADAGFKDQASLHDPLDPLGLTLATVIPFGFGAVHLRGVSKRAEAATLASVVQTIESDGKRYGKDGKILEGPPTKYGTAKGEMQVVDGTNLDPGFGVKPADMSGTLEQQAAERARVGRDYLAAMEQRYGGDPEKAMAAYNWGPGNLDKAIAKHGNDWLAHAPDETQKYVAKGSKLLGERTVAHAAADPDVVDAARVKVTNSALHQNLPDFPTAHAEVMRASDELAAGRFPEVQEPTITLYHGSPHEFDAFDSSKIGTGEGNQSYGHGMYLAETEAVARTYQKLGGDAGNIYKVQLPKSAADRMLDLDAPMSAQPEVVQRYFKENGDFRPDAPLTEHMAIDKFAAEKFREAGIPGVKYLDQDSRNAGGWHVTPPEHTASGKWMLKSSDYNSKGIHFDSEAEARSALAEKIGGETRNHVIFPGNENLLTIGERNGAPLRSEATNALPDPRQPTLESAAPKITADTESKGPASIDSQRVAAIAEADPGLKVVLPGSTEAITVGEALARAREQAKQEGGYAKLIKAAADCAVSFGA